MSTGRDGQKGFTLIELMMVVAIIGILAAISLSVFQNLTDSAQIAAEDGVVAALNSAAVITLGKNGVPPTEALVLVAVSPPVTDLGQLTGQANKGHSGVAYCTASIMFIATTAGNHPTSHTHVTACP